MPVLHRLGFGGILLLTQWHSHSYHLFTFGFLSTLSSVRKHKLCDFCSWCCYHCRCSAKAKCWFMISGVFFLTEKQRGRDTTASLHHPWSPLPPYMVLFYGARTRTQSLTYSKACVVLDEQSLSPDFRCLKEFNLPCFGRVHNKCKSLQYYLLWEHLWFGRVDPRVKL